VNRHPLTLLASITLWLPFVDGRRPQAQTLELIDGHRDATVVLG